MAVHTGFAHSAALRGSQAPTAATLRRRAEEAEMESAVLAYEARAYAAVLPLAERAMQMAIASGAFDAATQMASVVATLRAAERRTR